MQSFSSISTAAFSSLSVDALRHQRPTKELWREGGGWGECLCLCSWDNLCLCANVHLCAWVCVCMWVNVCVFECDYMLVCERVSECMCVCMWVCVCVCVCERVSEFVCLYLPEEQCWGLLPPCLLLQEQLDAEGLQSEQTLQGGVDIAGLSEVRQPEREENKPESQTQTAKSYSSKHHACT